MLSRVTSLSLLGAGGRDDGPVPILWGQVLQGFKALLVLRQPTEALVLCVEYLGPDVPLHSSWQSPCVPTTSWGMWVRPLSCSRLGHSQ